MQKIAFRAYISHNSMGLAPNIKIQKFEKFKEENDIDIDSYYYDNLRLKK